MLDLLDRQRDGGDQADDAGDQHPAMRWPPHRGHGRASARSRRLAVALGAGMVASAGSGPAPLAGCGTRAAGAGRVDARDVTDDPLDLGDQASGVDACSPRR